MYPIASIPVPLATLSRRQHRFESGWGRQISQRFTASQRRQCPSYVPAMDEERMTAPRRIFEVRAQWDAEAEVWWCANDELPAATEAPIVDQLVARVVDIV